MEKLSNVCPKILSKFVVEWLLKSFYYPFLNLFFSEMAKKKKVSDDN